LAGALAGAAALLAAASPAAVAGTFSVRACGAAAGVNRSWTLSNEGGGRFETPSVVGGHPVCDAALGLWAQDRLGAGEDPAAGTEARFTFTASPGTAVVGIAYDRRFYKLDDDAWDPAFLRTAETPVGAPLDGRCTFDPVERDDCGAAGAQSRTFAPTARLEFGLRCGPGSVFGVPTVKCLHGSTLHQGIAQLRSAGVTVSDTGSPSVGPLSGDATTQPYLRGPGATVSATASDAAGIRSARVLVDGTSNGDVIAGTCDTVPGNPSAYVTPKPCADRDAARPLAGAVDLTGLADGTHALSLRATDAAGNTGDAPARRIVVDRTPPGPPVDLAVASARPGRAGWELAPPAAMSWSPPPGQVAPVTTSHVRACREGGACRTTAVAGLALDADTLAGLLDQGDGVYAIAVSLGDAAGNGAGFDAARAATHVIRVDGTAPEAPTELSGGGVHARPDVTLRWTLPGAQIAPIDVVWLRLCALPAGDCTLRALPGAATSADVVLPAADVELRAFVWAEDQAGNADAARAAETVLRHHPDSPPPGPSPDGGAPSPTVPVLPDPPGAAAWPPGNTDPGVARPDAPGPGGPRAPRVRLAVARYAPATRRLTVTGTAAAGFDARAVVRLAISPRPTRTVRRSPPRPVAASRAVRVTVDRRRRFTVTTTLAASTGRAIRAARRTTVTLVIRASPAWRRATASQTLTVTRPVTRAAPKRLTTEQRLVR